MSLEFTLVRRAISLAVIDGPDTGDNPDILKAQGSVLFEPVIKKGDSIQVQTRGGSQTYALAPIECPINDGIISHRGQDGVKLPAGGEAANPSLIRWKATFSRMQAGGKSFTLAPVIFDAVPGGEIDLTMVAPVAGAPEGVVRGPRGTSLESIIVDGSELVFTAVDDAGSFEIARIPLDEMVRAEADAAADGVRDALAVDVAASQSARDAAEGHASRAATSESNAATSETNAKQSETNAGDYAAVATTAATEAVDAMEVITASNTVSRVDALEAMAGLTPDSPVDGQTANLVAQPDTLTRAAVVEAAADWDYARLDMPEQVAPIRVKWVETFQPGHGWTATNGTATDDSAVRVMGTQSLKVSGGYVQKALERPLDLSKNNLVLLIRVTESIKTNNISALISDNTSFKTFRSVHIARGSEASPWQRPGEWIQVTIPAFTNELGGVVDMSSIRLLRISGAGDYNIQAIGLTPKTAPTISISFDDGYASVIEAARRSMTPRGLRGTSYTIPSLVGSGSRFMTMEQTRELHDIHGWDIQAHTSAYYTEGGDNSALYEEMRDARKFIVNNGFGAGEHFAWAGGQSGPEAELVARKLFRSSRTVADPTTETIPPSRPHRMRAYSGIGGAGGRSVSFVKGLVDRTKNEGGWLHLVFHRITDVVETGNDCSWSDFEAILDYILESGIPVKTVSQALSAPEVAKTDVPIVSWVPTPAVFTGNPELIADRYRSFTKVTGAAADLVYGHRITVASPGRYEVKYESVSIPETTITRQTMTDQTEATITLSGGVATEVIDFSGDRTSVRVSSTPEDIKVTITAVQI